MQAFNARNLSGNNFTHALQALMYRAFIFIHGHSQHIYFLQNFDTIFKASTFVSKCFEIFISFSIIVF